MRVTKSSLTGVIYLFGLWLLISSLPKCKPADSPAPPSSPSTVVAEDRSIKADEYPLLSTAEVIESKEHISVTIVPNIQPGDTAALLNFNQQLIAEVAERIARSPDASPVITRSISVRLGTTEAYEEPICQTQSAEPLTCNPALFKAWSDSTKEVLGMSPAKRKAIYQNLLYRIISMRNNTYKEHTASAVQSGERTMIHIAGKGLKLAEEKHEKSFLKAEGISAEQAAFVRKEGLALGWYARALWHDVDLSR